MFRGLLRPGQGFRKFYVLRRQSGKTASGRVHTAELMPERDFMGIFTQASQKEKEQWKQSGHPITHTIVQRGMLDRAKPTDVIELLDEKRRFLVQGVVDPGELHHFTVYYVEERLDLQ